MRRAAEDEQPVDFLQASQFYLPQRAGLLQPPEALLHQPSPAEADGVSGLARGPSVKVATATIVVPRHMRRHVQLPYCADEILGVVSLVCPHGDSTGAILLLLVEHQQRGIALGETIGVCHHRRGNQTVSVLNRTRSGKPMVDGSVQAG